MIPSDNSSSMVSLKPYRKKLKKDQEMFQWKMRKMNPSKMTSLEIK